MVLLLYYAQQFEQWVYDDILRLLGPEQSADGPRLPEIPYFDGLIIRARDEYILVFVNDHHGPDKGVMSIQDPHIGVLVLQLPHSYPKVVELPTRGHQFPAIFHHADVAMV